MLPPGTYAFAHDVVGTTAAVTSCYLTTGGGSAAQGFTRSTSNGGQNACSGSDELTSTVTSTRVDTLTNHDASGS